MDRQLITISFRFIGLVLLQILVLNNIQFSSILNPFLYVYLIIVLPVDFRPSIALLLGFLLGLSVDVFCQTLGMHTIATTFAAFCRPYILLYMSPRDGYGFFLATQREAIRMALVYDLFWTHDFSPPPHTFSS